MKSHQLSLAVAALFLAMTGSPVVAQAGATPPLHHVTQTKAEPKLTVAHRALATSLACSTGLRGAKRDPILLVPGTTLDPTAGFSWNYERAFTTKGWPWCAVTLPGEAMADAQIGAQHIVYAIRRMHRLSGRSIDILGYSQGGMLPRWALKYWPDTRRDVNDYVGIDPSNHGTLDAVGVCAATCAPSIWQQAPNSKFLTALNAGPETWRGIDYTVVYSKTDEVVVPNLGPSPSSALHGGRGKIVNIAAQQICPLDASEHLAMGTYDPVAYAVAIDAFTHRGPAQPSRISPTVCSSLLQPGVDPSTFATTYATFAAHVATVLATYPHTAAEPPLASYAR